MKRHPEQGSSIRAAVMLLSLLVACTSLQAQPARLAVPMVMDADRVYVAAELAYEHLDPSLPIFQAGQMLAPPGEAEQTAAAFYTAAQAGDLSTLTSLYSQVDGSRDRLEAQLDPSSPDYIEGKFDGMSSLTAATLVAKGVWGPYQILSVVLSGGGDSGPWPLVLYCDQGACSVTDVFDGDTDGERLVDITLLMMAVVHADPQMPDYTDAVAATVANGRVLQVLPPLLPPGAGAYPLTLYFDLRLPADTNAFAIAEQVPTEAWPEVRFVVDLAAELQEAERGALDDIFNASVHEYDEAATLPMSSPDTASALGLKVTEHILPAFRDRVLSWSAVKVLGSAELETASLLFVEPLLKVGGSDSLQMLMVAPVGPDDALRLISAQGLNPPGEAMGLATVLAFVQGEYGDIPTRFATPTSGIDRVFSAGFQSGAGGPGWTCSKDAAHYAPATSELAYVTAPEQSGSGYAAHYYAKAGTVAAEPWRCVMDSSQVAVVFGGSPVGEVYAEWYEYFSPSYPFPSVQPLMALAFSDAGIPQSIKSTQVLLEEQNSRLLVRHRCGAQDASLCDVDLDVPAGSGLATGRWVKLGLWVKTNTPGQPDGFVRLFVDDALAGEASGVNLVGADDHGYDRIEIGGRYDSGGLPLLRGGSRYVDSFALFRSRSP